MYNDIVTSLLSLEPLELFCTVAFFLKFREYLVYSAVQGENRYFVVFSNFFKIRLKKIVETF